MLLQFLVFSTAFLIAKSSGLLICPPGFTLISNNKCAMHGYDTVTHKEAETQCKLHGATLYNVDNAIDNRALAMFIFEKSWIRTWIGLYCFTDKAKNCYWDNNKGTAASYNFFMERHIDKVKHCVTSYGYEGQWMSTDCRDEYPFVCQAPPTLQDDTCLHNFNGYCYLPSHEFPVQFQKKNMTDAHAYCLSINSIPVTIHSKLEHDFIRTMFLDSPVNVPKFLLGAQNNFWQYFDDFHWLDDSPWDFDFRDPMRVMVQQALVMETDGVGVWHEVDAALDNFFMCKRRAGGFQVVPEAPEAREAPESPKPLEAIASCNSTSFMTPGTINITLSAPTAGTPDPLQPAPCSFKLTTLGPYRISVYFTHVDIGIVSNLTVIDGYGNYIGIGTSRSIITAPMNEATVVFQWSGGRDIQVQATVLGV